VLKARFKRLEDVLQNRDGLHKVVLITYEESKKPKADAIVEWEAENGPVADYQIKFITSYETPSAGFEPFRDVLLGQLGLRWRLRQSSRTWAANPAPASV
jgi:hypothetical protein